MSRTLSSLKLEVREMLRAEGTSGGGYSDFIITKAINDGLADISTIYPIRSTVEIMTTLGQNEYDLEDRTLVPDGLTDVIRVTYKDRPINGISLDDFLTLHKPFEGNVRAWLLWGKTLLLVGAVGEDDSLKIFITRPAKPLNNLDDTPETPPVADKALVQYAIARCYQEARESEQFTLAMADFNRQRSALELHASPRGQRDIQTRIRDSYWKPIQSRSYRRTSDTRPH